MRVFIFVPPYNTSFLFLFITFIFSKFLFYHFLFPYFIYSIFFIVLIVFPGLFFQCPVFRLLHVISSKFPVVFPDHRSSHLPNSWPVISLVFFCQMSHSQFSSLLDGFSAFFFQFFSFHSSFPLSPNFRTVSQYLALPSKFSLSRILLFFLLHLSPHLFAIRFQAACLSCCLSS